MPYLRKKLYRRKRRVKRKRRYFKRRRPRASKMTYLKLRHPSAMPDQLWVKLKYVDQFSPNGLLNVDTNTYALNSCFDPDVTGAGHQPLGFDQWSGFYSNYEVKASRINCQMLDDSGAVIRQLIVYPSISSSATTIQSTAREQPYAKHRFTTSSATSQIAFVSNYMTVKKLEGRSTNSVNFSAAVDSNPATLRYWHCTVGSLTGIPLGSIFIDVKITYYVMFFRRRQLAES